jgi:hypothetical protein
VHLQIGGRDSTAHRACLMLALEPPGNVARELSLFRRSLFAKLGDASPRAFPEVAPLAFAVPRIDAPHRSRAFARALEELWTGIEGAFASCGFTASRNLFYLGLREPAKILSSRADEALEKLGLAAAAEPPLEAGKGFFLCRGAKPEPSATSLGVAPIIGFRDCSLVLLSFRFGPDPFSSMTWRELARAKRRTGPSPTPSRRKPR